MAGIKSRSGRHAFRRKNARVSRAIRAVGYSSIAAVFGVQRMAVYQWARAGHVPAERVLTLAPLIGLEPHEIRPDLYLAPEQTEAG